MAMTQVGEHGPNVRGDVRVTVEDGKGTEIVSSVGSIYGEALKKQVELARGAFGNPSFRIHLEDSGALPFVIEARLEAAICRHLGLPLPACIKAGGDSPKRRLRRSRLYLPGNTPRLFVNADLYRPDGLILDLEDSVAPDAKFAARALVRRALLNLEWTGIERIVRINAGDEGLADLRAVAPCGLDAVLVPKAESSEDIRGVEAVLEELNVATWIIPLVETARGIQHCFEIAASSNRVVAVAVGLEDYVADIRARRTDTGSESAWAQGQVVNAARAARVSPLASVFPRFDDEEAVYEYASRARQLGFDGVGCIHPRQIRTVHRAFVPTDREIREARLTVEVYETAISEGRGAGKVEGRMVDAPTYRWAQDVLEAAR